MNLHNHKMNPNVSNAERAISVLAGAYMLYDALGKKKKSLPEALLAGYMVLRGATGYCSVYNSIGKTKPDNRSRNVNIQVSLKVDKPREEVYNFWRRLENLPLFMEHLEMVNTIDDKISVWEAKIPGGIGNIRWRSEVVKEIPNELLGWQSLPDSTIENAGKVEFHDTEDFGTELHVVISYHAPWGIPGEGMARASNPFFKRMVTEDILNFKHYIESGKQDISEPKVKDSTGKFLV